MQDLKHLTQKNSVSVFKLFGFGARNKRLKPPTDPIRHDLLLPTGKRLRQLKLTLLFIAIVLVVAPLSVVALRKSQTIGAWITTVSGSIFTPAAPARPTIKPTYFETASDLLATAKSNGTNLYATTPDGTQYTYTIQEDMQRRVYACLEKYNVPYGVFVAIEPASGKILGMTAYSSIDPAWAKRSAYDLYPMASLFKIITASAALETHKITPESIVAFRGNSYSENPRYWDISPHGRNNSMNVSYAMGKSINPVYGRVASDIAGKPSVMEYVSRFGFNQELLPGTPAKQSHASNPANNHDLMLMGAGLDHDVKISPLHAAVIMSAIANNGKMMVPGLTSNIVDAQGVKQESFTQQEIRRLVTPETSAALTRMLSTTVLTGTSRKAFHDRRGRPLLDVSVAAKTGSIDGSAPKGHYSWFAAFAPAQNPQIALVALVINSDRWKIKASHVGAEALDEFFKK